MKYIMERECRPKKTTFSAPMGRSPPKGERVSGTNLRRCAKYGQIRSAVSEEMRPQTDRYRTNSKLRISNKIKQISNKISHYHIMAYNWTCYCGQETLWISNYLAPRPPSTVWRTFVSDRFFV